MPTQAERTQALLNRIAETKKAAGADLEFWPSATRPGKELQKATAKAELPALEGLYESHLRRAAVVIVLQGDADAQKAFQDLALTEGNTVNVSAMALYESLAVPVVRSLGASRMFGITQMQQLIIGLGNVGRDLGLREVTAPTSVPGGLEKHIQDADAAAQHCRYLVRSTMGDEVNKLFLRKIILALALEQKDSRGVIPVVVANAQEEAGVLALGLYGLGLSVSVPANVTKDFVLRAFAAVKEVVSNQRQGVNTET